MPEACKKSVEELLKNRDETIKSLKNNRKQVNKSGVTDCSNSTFHFNPIGERILSKFH